MKARLEVGGLELADLYLKKKDWKKLTEMLGTNTLTVMLRFEEEAETN